VTRAVRAPFSTTPTAKGAAATESLTAGGYQVTALCTPAARARSRGMASRLLTVAQVAERLAVSRSTAYRIVREMLRVHVGGQIRVPEDAVERYLARRTEAPWDESSSAATSGTPTTKTGKGSGKGRRSARETAASPKSGSASSSLLRPIRPRTA